MADNTTLSAAGPRPVVTISSGHPQRYSFTVVLHKPHGQLWPDGKPGKLLMNGRFDEQHQPPQSITVAADPAGTMDLADLAGCSLQWVVFVKVPGGGKGQFRVTVDVRQNGQIVGGPFTNEGVVDDTEAIADFSDFDVS